MGCNSCSYLKKDNKKNGVTGSCYFCTKIKKYVNGAYSNCDNYLYDYTKNTLDKNEIYRNGITYSSDNININTYIVILVFLIILCFIINLNLL